MDSQFSLIIDSEAKLIGALAGYKIIKLFVDQNVDSNLYAWLKKCINASGANVLTVSTSAFTEADAINLPYSGEDFVLAVGGLDLQSVAKYYAYCFGLKYGILPVKEMCDYTFSKFCYLKSTTFCFYECEPPLFGYICSNAFSQIDENKIYSALTYKNINSWENEFASVVFGNPQFADKKLVCAINLCQKRLQPVSKLMAGIGLLASQNTNFSFGAEYVLLSLTSGSMSMDKILSAQILLSKFYQCMMRFEQIDVELDLNRHIKKLKDCFGLDFLWINRTIRRAPTISQKTEIKNKFMAYYPHLRALLSAQECKYCAYSAVSNIKLGSALALSADLCASNNALTFARDMGYFEELIKDI